MITIASVLKKVCEHFDGVSYEEAIALFDDVDVSVKMTKKAKKVKNTDGIKRPKNSFIYFMDDNRATIYEDLASKSDTKILSKDVTARGGEIWRSMSTSEKEPYIKLYKADKERFEKERADYLVINKNTNDNDASSVKSDQQEKSSVKKNDPEAKKAEREAKKAAAKAEREAKKAAEKEAKKAEREAKKAAEKEAKKAEREAKKAAAKAEREAKKAAEKEAKKAEREAKKADAKAKSVTSIDSPGVDSMVSEQSLSPTETASVSCDVIKFEGVEYLVDEEGTVYSIDTHEMLGMWDDNVKKIIFTEYPDSDEE
jgi:pyruvate/2-oxoglutarate dehydrogenase complex dihydrolipoamide acyltransferase (E2) component